MLRSPTDTICGLISTNSNKTGGFLRPRKVLLGNTGNLARNVEFRAKFNHYCRNRAGVAGGACSTKRYSYGGCIPSILQAIETVLDLDEALKPWEGSLSSKERTIILKEQTDWRRALEIFDWFKRKGCYEVNVIHYNIILRILGRAKRWDLVEAIWGEMQLNRVLPTNSTYGTMIDAFSKGGLDKEALVWLGEMCKQGMEPDEVTMGIVVQAYKRAGEFRMAEEFFKRWSSPSGCDNDDDDDFKMHQSYSLVTYNTMIDMYGKAGLLKEASATFAGMLREGIAPDRVTFNTMIHVCGSHGHLEEVASLLAMMEELRCYPDTRTYNILISLYLKSDDIGGATRYFSKMKSDGLVPDIVSYRTLLYAFSIRNMVGESEALLSEMEEMGLEIDEYTQSALTRMYVGAGMLEQSWSWFEKYQYNMSSECFSANIDAFGEHSQVLLAEKAFICCLERQKMSVLVFNVMIKAYQIGKKHDKACELFDSMENYGVVPDKCSYSSLIQILTVAELPHKAMTYIRRMLEEGLVSDCVPYSMVLNSFAKFGELTSAENLFKDMVSFGVQPDIVVFSILINAFAEVGNVQEALEYFDSMKRAGFSVNRIVCNSLIKLYTKVGYLQEAQRTYEMFNSLEGGPDVYSSNCMIDLYCKNAMVKEAEEIFKNLKCKREANEFSYMVMLTMYRKIGQNDEAYQIARDMLDLGLLTSTLSYNNMIEFYASDGRLKEAVKCFQQMLGSDIPPNDATFRLLGAILLKRGVPKDAISYLELTRRKDAKTGLHEWVKAALSLVKLGDNAMKYGGKLKGHFDIDPTVKNAFRSEHGSTKEKLELQQCSYI